jgi:hypothetical protein
MSEDKNKQMSNKDDEINILFNYTYLERNRITIV